MSVLHNFVCSEIITFIFFSPMSPVSVLRTDESISAYYARCQKLAEEVLKNHEDEGDLLEFGLFYVVIFHPHTFIF